MNYKPSYTAEMNATSNGRLDVKVSFRGGKSYIVAFCDTTYIEAELNNVGCVAIPGLIMIDEATIDRAEEMLDFVVSSGFFNALRPIEEDGE